MQTPFSPLSFGKSFMKIRSAFPENGCLVFLWRTEKKNKKTSVKHMRIRLIGGCVNKQNENTGETRLTRGGSKFSPETYCLKRTYMYKPVGG